MKSSLYVYPPPIAHAIYVRLSKGSFQTRVEISHSSLQPIPAEPIML